MVARSQVAECEASTRSPRSPANDNETITIRGKWKLTGTRAEVALRLAELISVLNK